MHSPTPVLLATAATAASPCPRTHNSLSAAEASGGPNTPAANNNDQTGAALGPAAQDAALANSAQHNNNQQQQQGADHDDMPPLPFPLPPEADVVMMDAGPAPMQGPQQGGAGVAADLDINGPLLIDAIAAAEAEAPDGAAAAAPALPAAGAGPVDMEADDDAAAAWEWNQDVAQLVGGLLQLVNGPDCPLTARVLLAVLLDFILHWLGMGGVLDILEDGLIAAAQHAYAEACTQGGTVPSFLQFPGLVSFRQVLLAVVCAGEQSYVELCLHECQASGELRVLQQVILLGQSLRQCV